VPHKQLIGTSLVSCDAIACRFWHFLALFAGLICYLPVYLGDSMDFIGQTVHTVIE
jgi:hypothetical protein